jgi:hypothetical protein
MASSTTQLQPARMQHAAADLNTAHGAHGMNASITTPVADTESPAPRTVQKPRILVVDDDRRCARA